MIGLLQTILGLLTVANPAAAIYVSVPAALPAGVLVESRLDHTEAYAAGIQCLRGMGGLDRGYLVAVRGSSGAACGERPIISQCALLVALKRGVGRVAFGSGKTRRKWSEVPCAFVELTLV